MSDSKSTVDEDDTQYFYVFDQSNPGGSYDPDAAKCVIILAESLDDANEIAEEKDRNTGIYFNGMDKGIDCKCCNDRWYPVYRTDKLSVKLSYVMKHNTKNNDEFFVVFDYIERWIFHPMLYNNLKFNYEIYDNITPELYAETKELSRTDEYTIENLNVRQNKIYRDTIDALFTMIPREFNDVIYSFVALKKSNIFLT